MEKQITQLKSETRTLFEEKLHIQEVNEKLSLELKLMIE